MRIEGLFHFASGDQTFLTYLECFQFNFFNYHLDCSFVSQLDIMRFQMHYQVHSSV